MKKTLETFVKALATALALFALDHWLLVLMKHQLGKSGQTDPDGIYKEYNSSTSLLEKREAKKKHGGHSPDFSSCGRSGWLCQV